MAPLGFVSLVGASALLFHWAHSLKNPIPTAVEIKCLPQLNEARKAVNFPEFEEEHRLLPTSTNTDLSIDGPLLYWQTVCKAIQQREQASRDGDAGSSELPVNPSGTYAYFETADSTDCAAAVEYWKGGFALIGPERPGSFTAERDSITGEAPFNTTQAVSFAALYNPQQDAKAQCVFLTCPEQLELNLDAGVAKITAKEATALICLSHPHALKIGEAPYTEEQWTQILDVFAPNSASLAAPTFLALAAAAVGLAYL